MKNLAEFDPYSCQKLLYIVLTFFKFFFKFFLRLDSNIESKSLNNTYLNIIKRGLLTWPNQDDRINKLKISLFWSRCYYQNLRFVNSMVWIDITSKALFLIWSSLVKRHLFWPHSMVYISVIITHILQYFTLGSIQK